MGGRVLGSDGWPHQLDTYYHKQDTWSQLSYLNVGLEIDVRLLFWCRGGWLQYHFIVEFISILLKYL